MDVYVLTEENPYEPSEVLGAAASLGGAEALAQGHYEKEGRVRVRMPLTWRVYVADEVWEGGPYRITKLPVEFSSDAMVAELRARGAQVVGVPK